MTARLAFILALLAPCVAHSHDWYPAACCAGQDCRPVDCDALREEEHGAISYSPKTAAYPPEKQATYVFSRDKVKPSQDDKCHACIRFGVPLCVFVQQGS
jgi:hypothetical protein